MRVVGMVKVGFILLAIEFLGIGGSFLWGQEQAPLPNILLILADDLGQGDLTSYNPESKVETPNMDRMVEEGMKFTDGHSNSSVCSPTRYGVLTGRYSWRTSLKSGIVGALAKPLITQDRLTLQKMLRTKGYRTAGVGKWHLGMTTDGGDWSKPLISGPKETGFDYSFFIPSSLDIPPYVYVEDGLAVEEPTADIEASPWPAFWRKGKISPSIEMVDVLGDIKDKGRAFIRSHVDSSDAPFFLYLPLTSPHTPHIVPPEWEGKTTADTRGDFVAYTDWIMGEVINLLDTLEIAENTMVMITADNGAHDKTYQNNGHTPHMNYKGQKADIYEAGHRVPFIWKWPGVVAEGSVSDQTVCLTDYMATLSAIVGYELPSGAGEDSYSLLPLLMEKEIEGNLREATIHHSLNGTFAIRQGDWKLTDNNKGSGGFTNPKVTAGEGTLYNLAEDISETTDLYADEGDIVSDMRDLLNQYKSSGRSTPQNRNDEFWERPVALVSPALSHSSLEEGVYYDLSGNKIKDMGNAPANGVYFLRKGNNIYREAVVGTVSR